jgi:hypothetical protein
MHSLHHSPVHRPLLLLLLLAAFPAIEDMPLRNSSVFGDTFCTAGNMALRTLYRKGAAGSSVSTAQSYQGLGNAPNTEAACSYTND